MDPSLNTSSSELTAMAENENKTKNSTSSNPSLGKTLFDHMDTTMGDPSLAKSFLDHTMDTTAGDDVSAPSFDLLDLSIQVSTFLDKQMVEESVTHINDQLTDTGVCFTCNECWEMFFDVASYHTHVREFHISQIFPCTKCVKVFSCKKFLDMHDRTAHKPPKTCPICQISVKSVAQHMKIHDQARPQHKCTQCEKSLKCKRSLERHTRIIHNGEYFCYICGKFVAEEIEQHKSEHKKAQKGKEITNYVCAVCQKLFMSRQNMSIHMRTHFKNFSCTVCKRAFSFKSELRRHVEVKHNPEHKFECTECLVRYPSGASLAKHEQKHENEKFGRSYSQLFSCSVCVAKFTTAKIRDNHVSTLHNPLNPIVCKCLARYTTKLGLKRHKKQHCPLKKRKSKRKDQTFYCDGCKKSHSDKHSLKLHIKIQHNPLNMFNCLRCNYRYQTKDALKRHTTVSCKFITRFRAPKGSVFRCNECRRTFKSKGRVANHLRSVHNPENMFVCQKCKSRCPTKGALQRHTDTYCFYAPKRSHPLGQLYSCNECTKKFKIRHDLQSHWRDFHNPMHAFECRKCHYRYISAETLENHEQIYCKYAVRQPKPIKKPEIHHCFLCKKKLASKRSLADHLTAKHHPLYEFKCPKCFVHYETAKARDRHMLSIHSVKKERIPGEIIYKRRKTTGTQFCCLCPETFLSISDLKSHELNVHNQTFTKPLPCHLCKKFLLPKRKIVKNHMLGYHGLGGEIFSCDICKKNHNTVKGIRYHMRIHFKEYSCPTCLKLFCKKRELLDHEAAKHGAERTLVSCTLCSKTSHSTRGLLLHMEKSHNPLFEFQCVKCNYRYPTAEKLANHGTGCYRLSRKSDTIKAKNDRCVMYKCSECNKKLKSQEGLDFHFQNTHNFLYASLFSSVNKKTPPEVKKKDELITESVAKCANGNKEDQKNEKKTGVLTESETVSDFVLKEISESDGEHDELQIENENFSESPEIKIDHEDLGKHDSSESEIRQENKTMSSPNKEVEEATDLQNPSRKADMNVENNSLVPNQTETSTMVQEVPELSLVSNVQKERECVCDSSIKIENSGPETMNNLAGQDSADTSMFDDEISIVYSYTKPPQNDVPMIKEENVPQQPMETQVVEITKDTPKDTNRDDEVLFPTLEKKNLNLNKSMEIIGGQNSKDDSTPDEDDISVVYFYIKPSENEVPMIKKENTAHESIESQTEKIDDTAMSHDDRNVPARPKNMGKKAEIDVLSVLQKDMKVPELTPESCKQQSSELIFDSVIKKENETTKIHEGNCQGTEDDICVVYESEKSLETNNVPPYRNKNMTPETAEKHQDTDEDEVEAIGMFIPIRSAKLKVVSSIKKETVTPETVQDQGTQNPHFEKQPEIDINGVHVKPENITLETMGDESSRNPEGSRKRICGNLISAIKKENLSQETTISQGENTSAQTDPQNVVLPNIKTENFRLETINGHGRGTYTISEDDMSIFFVKTAEKK